MSDIPASTTIMEIKDTLGLVFEGGEPMNEEWLIVLMLNSLSDGNYDWLRKDLLGFITNTNIAITSEDIIEQIVTEHHKGTRAVESALAAKQWTHSKSKSKYCTREQITLSVIAGRKVVAAMQTHQTGSKGAMEISPRRRRI